MCKENGLLSKKKKTNISSAHKTRQKLARCRQTPSELKRQQDRVRRSS